MAAELLQASRLLEGAAPSMFGGRVLFISMEEEPAPAPKGFEEHWFSFAAKTADLDGPTYTWLSEEELERACAMVLVAEVPNERQEALIAALGGHLRRFPWAAPPVILLPVRCAGAHQDVHACIQRLLQQASVDDVIWGEPAGPMLAFALQAKLRNLNVQLVRLQDELARRAAQSEDKERIAANIDFARWHYLRSRMLHAIPPIRNDLNDDDGQGVAGFTLGGKLSRGMFGTVHTATRQVPGAPGNSQSSAVLVVDKRKQVHGLYDLRMINRFLQVLESLARTRHPNLSQHIDTFHSPTRLYVCMELGGSRTLFSRLKLRDGPPEGTNPQPLASEVMRSLILQACDAICHLHQVAHVCHRDVKPENFTVQEHADGTIDVKLGGFELAMVQAGNQQCKSACGTMPFAAPEMILAGQGGYDGMAADMWSLGILLLEVACGLRSVERAVLGKWRFTDATEAPVAPSMKVARKFQAAFGQPGAAGRFFQQAVPEAGVLTEWLLPAVDGLLKVSHAERLTAPVLHQALVVGPR